MPVAVILNDLETNVVEPEHNISAGNDGIGFLVGLQEFQWPHPAVLATAHWPGQQQALVGIDAVLFAAVIVLDV